MQLALGWTILHSLWQSVAAALVLALTLAIVRSSRSRYAAACLAMLALLIAFGMTFATELKPHRVTIVNSVSHASRAPVGVGNALQHMAARSWAPAILPWLTPLWIAGVAAFHLYGLASWLAVRRMLRRGVCAAPEIWRRRLGEIAEHLRVSKPVSLLESSLAEVPVVIGHLRPAILVPIGMLTGMPALQIESILMHELAHIRRRDYLVNLLQMVLEGFLFYHPAVWWMSHVIRSERENCCDDLVVAHSGDAREYVAALTHLEQIRWATEVAPAATGGNLMKRIRRLLYPADTPRAVLTPLLSGAILIITAMLGFTSWQQAKAQETSASTPYTKWLNQDVAYIISDQERAAFVRLQTDPERRMFIAQFWLRRDPTPGTVENEAKQEHYRRLAYANDHFTDRDGVIGWKTDRGRTYILQGPPDEIESHPSGGEYNRPAEEGGGNVETYPFEKWTYRHLEGIGNNVVIEFVDPARTGAFHMTQDPQEKVIRK